jgi:hypothetical protein
VPVACPTDAAFRVFTEATGTWWPPGHTTGEPGSRIAIEPFVGGRFFERNAAREEIEWGRVLHWERPRRLAYTWHLRADRADATEIWITLEPDAGGWRLEIEHRGSTIGGAGSPNEPPSRGSADALPRRSLRSLSSPDS